MPAILETPITFVLLIMTGITSYQAMTNYDLKAKLIFNAAIIQERKEWYRFWSHGLIHGDWVHLAVNMFVLYQFGSVVELVFKMHFGPLGSLYYLLLYGLGLAAASLFSFFKHRHNYAYNALGASGAVSGIVFAYILFLPTSKLSFIFLPFLEIPAVIMGVGYLIYSQVMSKRGRDNIGHDAHFWGAVWGFFFTAALDYHLLINFWIQVTTPAMWGF